MTPKEKAQELVERFQIDFNLFSHDANGETIISTGKLTHKSQKRCALIAVDELIKEHSWANPISWNLTRIKYWQQVKSEIEKL